MKECQRYIFLLIFGLLFTVSLHAGKYVGMVVDETGDPLAGALVNIKSLKKTIVSDNAGNFSFVAPGDKISVTITYVGYLANTVDLLSESDIDINIIKMIPDETALGEVVVTATRTPKSLKDVPIVTRVISAKEIEKTDANNIQDLLTEEIPGLEFGYSMSQEASLSMSGFGGNAVLFLVDGERLAGETLDNVDYNRLNLSNVGQVEIVKGAASALYGANAIGGVVNLITKESKDPWRVNVNSRYKNIGDEWRVGGDINFNNTKWNSNTSVQYSTSKTVKLTSAFDTESKIHNIYGGNTLNLKERLIYTLSNNLRLIGRGGYFSRVSNRSTYDDHYHDYTGGLKGEWQIDGNRNLELSYSYDQYDKARFVNGVRTHDHDYSNRQHVVHALFNNYWGGNVLTAGADFMHDFLTTYQFTDNQNHSQSSIDAFLQFDYNPLTWLNVIASVRDDYFSESDKNALTAKLALMFKLKPLTLRASYSGGFRAPTLKEMYMNFDMAGIQMIYGNPDLKPERSQNFNAAIERNGLIRSGVFAGSYSLSLSGYYNYYNNRITTADFEGNATQEAGAIYSNEKGVKVSGLDFNARYSSNIGIGASLSYNYLHVAHRSIDSQFSQPRPHSATWRIDYEKRLNRMYMFYVGLSGRYLAKADSRYETDGAYSIWKFTLQQQVWRGININFIIDNLFNYKPKVYYWNSAPTTGISYSIGISLDINKFFK